MSSREEYKKEDKDRFLQLLRAHLVLAGGVEMSDEYLKAQPLSAILNMCFNNGVGLMISQKVKEGA